MTTKFANVAIIGAGLMGSSHAQTYHWYDRSNLVYICDQDMGRARELAEKYHCSHTGSYAELAASEADAVVIATPDFAHFDAAMAMLEAGKQVLIEKPLTTDIAEARQLVAAARSRGLILMVNYPNRWNAQATLAKHAIVEGKIGQPVMIHSRLGDVISVATEMLSWAGQSGPQWFLFSHTIDLVRWLIGQNPHEVFAVGTKGVLSSQGIDTYDTIQALVKFPVATACFETSWILPNSWPSVTDSKLSISGTAGCLNVDFSNQGVNLSDERFEYLGVTRLLDLRGKLRGMIVESRCHFIDCVLDGMDPISPGEDDLATVATICAIEVSLETGQPVTVEHTSAAIDER